MSAAQDSGNGAATLPDEVWVTKDGRQIYVRDMDEDHVRNALRMILRNSRRRLTLKRALILLANEIDEALAEEHKWGDS